MMLQRIMKEDLLVELICIGASLHLLQYRVSWTDKIFENLLATFLTNISNHPVEKVVESCSQFYWKDQNLSLSVFVHLTWTATNENFHSMNS